MTVMQDRQDTPRHLGRELLQDMAAKVSELTQTMLGVSEVKAKVFAQEVAGWLADDWGGQSVYIPMDLVGRLSKRNHQIYREFTGNNQPELATKYNLSVQCIYRILKAQIELRAPKQLSLLDASQP